MLALAGQRHDLTTVPLKQVSKIANQIGAEVSLSPGTARRVLLAHVRALQNGSRRRPTEVTPDEDPRYIASTAGFLLVVVKWAFLP